MVTLEVALVVQRRHRMEERSTHNDECRERIRTRVERTLWSTQVPRVTEHQCLDAKAETRSSCCGTDTILVRDLHIASHRFISKNSLSSKTAWMQHVNSDLVVEMCDACHRRQEKVDAGRAVSKSSKIRLEFLQKLCSTLQPISMSEKASVPCMHRTNTMEIFLRVSFH